MWTFNFTPKPRVCPKCNSTQSVVLVQMTNGTQKQKCKNCKSYV